jgi:hypothetical protein
VVCDAAENIGKPGLRIDTIELGGFDQTIGQLPLICRRFQSP